MLGLLGGPSCDGSPISVYRFLAARARSPLDLIVRQDQVDMADAERQRQFIGGDHGWVPPPTLKATEIEARAYLDLLLGQLFGEFCDPLEGAFKSGQRLLHRL